MNSKDRLKQLREGLRLSQPKFGDALGLKSNTINNIEGGYQKLSPRIALILKDKIVADPCGRLRIISQSEPQRSNEANLRTEWLLYGEGDPFEKMINSESKNITIAIKSDTVLSCGGGYNVIDEKSQEIIQLPKNNDIVFFRVSGDSMQTEFKSGDIVAINTAKTELISGKLYMISIDGDVSFKELHKLGTDKIQVVSYNKDVMPSFSINIYDCKICGMYEYMIRV